MPFLQHGREVFTILGIVLLRLHAEGDTLGKASETTGGLAENGATFFAADYYVSVREELSDGLAGVALDIHVVRVWALDDALELVDLGLLEG